MPKLILSVTKLSSGDTFKIGMDTEATVDFTVVDNSDVIYSEVQETASIQPFTKAWNVAVDRLVEAFSLLPYFTSVQRIGGENSTLIEIDSSDGFDAGNFSTSPYANGTLLEWVQIIQDNGSVDDKTTFPAVFGDPLVPNVIINSITYESVDFNKGSTPFLEGNLLEKIRCTINFTVPELLTNKLLNYNFGLVENQTVYYRGLDQDNPFKIDDSFLNSLVTGTQQGYSGSATLNARQPIFFSTGNASFSQFAGNTYELEHEFIPFVLREEDININGNAAETPEIFEGNKTIKHLTEINVFPSLYSSNPEYSTAQQDLTTIIKLGTYGYNSEIYNSGNRIFTLDTFTWSNEQNELNNGDTSSATVTIDSNVALSTSDELVLSIQNIKQPNEENKALTDADNLNIDRVLVALDGVSVNGTSLQNVTADFSGTTITLTFDVLENNYTDLYGIVANIFSNSQTVSQAEILKISTAISDANTNTVIIDRYEDALETGHAFMPHYQPYLSENTSNNITASVEDHIIDLIRITDLSPSINQIESITVSVQDRNTGVLLEKYTALSSELPLTIERDFDLDDTERKQVSFVENGNSIDISYGFQILEEWTQYESVFVRAEVLVTQTLADGSEAQFRKQFDSDDIKVIDTFDYDLTTTDTNSPQVLIKSVEYTSPDGLTNYGSIRNTGKTLVKFTFEDKNTNTNSLDANPQTPINFVYEDLIPNRLTGYFNLVTNEDINSEKQRFHSHRVNQQSPFEEVFGFPTYNAKIERIDIKTAVMTALINADKITQQFGDDFECLNLSARIDKVQIPEPIFCFDTGFDVPTDGSFEVYTLLNNPNGTFTFIDGTTATYDNSSGIPNTTIIADRTSFPLNNPFTANELNGTVQRVCFEPANGINEIRSLRFIGQDLRNTFDVSLVENLDYIWLENNPNLDEFIAIDGRLYNNIIIRETNVSTLRLKAVSIQVIYNNNLTSLNLDSINGDSSSFLMNGNPNLIQDLDFSVYNNISIFQIVDTPITAITNLVSTNGANSQFRISNTDITTLDLSNVASCSVKNSPGVFDNTSLTTIIGGYPVNYGFPVQYDVRLFNNALTSVDVSRYVSDSLANGILRYQNNNMGTTALNTLLSDLLARVQATTPEVPAPVKGTDLWTNITLRIDLNPGSAGIDISAGSPHDKLMSIYGWTILS